MCGRYWIDPRQIQFDFVKMEIKEKRDVYPQEICNVLDIQNQKIIMKQYKWGISLGNYKKIIINARAETVCYKPLFQQAFQTHRIIIPASGYYEWDSRKRKYAFSSTDTLYMAGIVKGDTFVIITTQANPKIQEIHDRMPLFIEKTDVMYWLSDVNVATELLQKNTVNVFGHTDFKQCSLF